MTELSPEARFIVLATRQSALGAPLTLQLSSAAVRDWPHLAQLAIRHRVTGFVLDAAARTALALP